MAELNSILIDLRISPEEYLKLYAGVAQNVRVRSRNGLRVQFPASALRPYVTAKGICGSFQLLINEDNKLIEINRIA